MIPLFFKKSPPPSLFYQPPFTFSNYLINAHINCRQFILKIETIFFLLYLHIYDFVIYTIRKKYYNTILALTYQIYIKKLNQNLTRIHNTSYLSSSIIRKNFKNKTGTIIRAKAHKNVGQLNTGIRLPSIFNAM